MELPKSEKRRLDKMKCRYISGELHGVHKMRGRPNKIYILRLFQQLMSPVVRLEQLSERVISDWTSSESCNSEKDTKVQQTDFCVSNLTQQHDINPNDSILRENTFYDFKSDDEEIRQPLSMARLSSSKSHKKYSHGSCQIRKSSKRPRVEPQRANKLHHDVDPKMSMDSEVQFPVNDIVDETCNSVIESKCATHGDCRQNITDCSVQHSESKESKKLDAIKTRKKKYKKRHHRNEIFSSMAIDENRHKISLKISIQKNVQQWRPDPDSGSVSDGNTSENGPSSEKTPNMMSINGKMKKNKKRSHCGLKSPGHSKEANTCNPKTVSLNNLSSDKINTMRSLKEAMLLPQSTLTPTNIVTSKISTVKQNDPQEPIDVIEDYLHSTKNIFPSGPPAIEPRKGNALIPAAEEDTELKITDVVSLAGFVKKGPNNKECEPEETETCNKSIESSYECNDEPLDMKCKLPDVVPPTLDSETTRAEDLTVSCESVDPKPLDLTMKSANYMALDLSAKSRSDIPSINQNPTVIISKTAANESTNNTVSNISNEHQITQSKLTEKVSEEQQEALLSEPSKRDFAQADLKTTAYQSTSRLSKSHMHGGIDTNEITLSENINTETLQNEQNSEESIPKTAQGHPEQTNYSSKTTQGHPEQINYSIKTTQGHPEQINYSSKTTQGHPEQIKYSSKTTQGHPEQIKYSSTQTCLEAKQNSMVEAVTTVASPPRNTDTRHIIYTSNVSECSPAASLANVEKVFNQKFPMKIATQMTPIVSRSSTQAQTAAPTTLPAVSADIISAQMNTATQDVCPVHNIPNKKTNLKLVSQKVTMTQQNNVPQESHNHMILTSRETYRFAPTISAKSHRRKRSGSHMPSGHTTITQTPTQHNFTAPRLPGHASLPVTPMNDHHVTRRQYPPYPNILPHPQGLPREIQRPPMQAHQIQPIDNSRPIRHSRPGVSADQKVIYPQHVMPSGESMSHQQMPRGTPQYPIPTTTEVVRSPHAVNDSQQKHMMKDPPPYPGPPGTRMAVTVPTQRGAATMLLTHMSCDVCSLNANFLCSGCKRVAYCSARCQYVAWKKHRSKCLR